MSLAPDHPIASPPPDGVEAPTVIDNTFLEGLVGYNARRAAIAVIGVFLERMAPYGFRVVDFSVLTLIAHNPGITSRQLSSTLSILPPNLVGMVRQMQSRGLIEKRPHPSDRRAQGLYVTPAGQRLQAETQAVVAALESDATDRLTEVERATLIQLLRKVYERDEPA
jgi:DNA-binding MarR family transcriptional regulator